jgi:AcrR family transcriptional regulator
MRLIEAAETLFIRKGFDDASVNEISELAGFSRGAFYSNFDDRDQLFLAVLDRSWSSFPKALDDIFRQISEPSERAAAVQEWFSNQWRLKAFTALQLEFSRRAMKDRSVSKRLAQHRREELEMVTASLVRFFGAAEPVPAEWPKVLALVLLAVVRGLGSLAIEADPGCEQLYTEAAKLAFDRMTATQTSQIG